MKLQEYKQLVEGKLGIRQDTVKQQWGLIRWMIDNNINDPNHGITIKTLSRIFSVGVVHESMEALRRDISYWMGGWMMERPATPAGMRILMSSLWTAERRVLIVWTSRDLGRWWR